MPTNTHTDCLCVHCDNVDDARDRALVAADKVLWELQQARTDVLAARLAAESFVAKKHVRQTETALVRFEQQLAAAVKQLNQRVEHAFTS